MKEDMRKEIELHPFRYMGVIIMLTMIFVNFISIIFRYFEIDVFFIFKWIIGYIIAEIVFYRGN